MSSRLRKYQNRHAALVKEMEGLLAKADAEDRELDAEETKRFEASEAELAEVKVKLAREESLLEHERNLPRMADINEDTEPERRSRNGEQDAPQFASLGEFAQAVVSAGSPGGSIDRRLLIGAATGLSEGVPADGGFLVQTDMQAGLLQLLHNTSVVWSRAQNIPISSNANGVKINAINEASRADGSRWGGILAYWKAEAAAKTASLPEFRQIELNLKKLIGLCYATDELIQDASALESILQQGFVEEFGFKLDDAVINGTGAGQPLGILNAACTVSVAKEVGQAAATIVAENVEKMYARLWAPSMNNAVWLINQDCWPQIFQLHHAVGAGGVPMFIPAGGINATPFGTLLGRPILPIEQCATLGTVGDIILADLAQYVTCDKGGIQSASSIHLKFNYDETCFRWVYRADGQPKWAAALTPYTGAANTQSPFITLATRA